MKTNTKENNVFTMSVSLLALFTLCMGQLLFIGAKDVQAQRNRGNSDTQRKVRAQKQKVDGAKSQIRSSAMRFDRSLRQVTSLSRSTINTKKDIDRIVSTLRQNRTSLNKGHYSKMVNMAANDTSFKRAVETAAKRVGYDRFIKQLESNPKSVMRISGAGNLQSKMQNNVRQQANNLKALAAKLKVAQSKFEREAKSQPRTRRTSFKRVSYSSNSAVNYASYDVSSVFNPRETNLETGYSESYEEMNNIMYRIPVAIEAALISAAVIIIGAAASAAVMLIAAWAQEKKQDFTDEDKDTGKTQFRECTDEADSDYDACLDGVNTYIPSNANFWQRKVRELEIAGAQAACTAGHALRMADCLLLPQ